MKIGICAWVLPGEAIDSFSKASALGLDGVVIDFGTMDKDNPLLTDYGQQVFLAEAKKHKIEIPTMAVNLFCDKSMTKADHVSEAKKIMAEAIRVAAAMGIPKIQVPSFYQSLIQTEEDLDHTIDVFKFACQLGEEKGVIIGSENIMTINQHQRFYSEVTSKSLTTLFDTQNPWRMLNQDGVKIAAYLAPYVGELHAKDSDPKIDGFVPLGEGDVGANESMTIFANCGFDGWIQLESMYESEPDFEAYIHEDIRRIKKIFSR